MTCRPLEEMADAAPVRKLLNYVLLVAIRDKASDIHFEPFEDEFKIRYRIDGVLYEMVPPPKQLAIAIASRIKVMSELDIAERRLPQDGRMDLNISGNPVELRVAVLPTMFGESCVLRVLDRSVVEPRHAQARAARGRTPDDGQPPETAQRHHPRDRTHRLPARPRRSTPRSTPSTRSTSRSSRPRTRSSTSSTASSRSR